MGHPGKRSIEERLERKIVRAKASHLVADECHLWQGARIMGRPGRRAYGGYGQIKIGGGSAVPTLVHRLTYERKYGPIPEGVVLDHVCNVRNCVNPDHIELVDHGENIRRGFARKAA